ncbi:MAG: hypothetical protein AB8B74_02650 [Crocinitomicaceae bacterium]
MNKGIILWCWILLVNTSVFSQSVKEQFAKSILTNNISSQKSIAKNLSGSYSTFAYTYYGLMLGNLPKQSILITNAYDDTFPLRVLQLTRSVRTDVAVISAAMLKTDSLYRDRISKRYSLKLEGKSITKQIQIIINNHNNVFVSTTVNHSIWYKPKYYLIGLSIQPNNNQNTNRLIAFYQSFQKLKLNTYQFNHSDRQIIQNLLPPLITLYKNGNSLPNLKADILMIADIVGKRDKVIKILEAK